MRLFFQACDWLEALSSVMGSGISELVQGKASKLKHGGGGAVLPPKLARAFNAYLIGTSIQRLPNWHERLTLT